MRILIATLAHPIGEPMACVPTTSTGPGDLARQLADHLSEDEGEPDRTSDNYARLWDAAFQLACAAWNNIGQHQDGTLAGHAVCVVCRRFS